MTTLLIVDDEPDIVGGLKFQSEMLGYSAVCKTQWTPEVVAENPDIDVLILDLHLPGLDGFDAFENLARAGFDKPIMLISGMDSSVINAIKVGEIKALILSLVCKSPLVWRIFLELFNKR